MDINDELSQTVKDEIEEFFKRLATKYDLENLTPLPELSWWIVHYFRRRS